MADNDDSVDMIGHNDKRIGVDAWEFSRDLTPPIGNHTTASRPRQGVIVGDAAEQTRPALRAHRHEIDPRLTVVVPAQPNGTAAVELGGVPHRPRLLLHQPPLRLRQPVEVVHHAINLAVRPRRLALQVVPLVVVRLPLRRDALLQVQHLLHKPDNAVAPPLEIAQFHALPTLHPLDDTPTALKRANPIGAIVYAPVYLACGFFGSSSSSIPRSL